MEEKLEELRDNLIFMFAYQEKIKYYDRLIKNEGNDKYIMSLVEHISKKQKVEVFRVSKILEPRIRKRINLLDQGDTVVHTCKTYRAVYAYLSDVMTFCETTGAIVR